MRTVLALGMFGLVLPLAACASGGGRGTDLSWLTGNGAGGAGSVPIPGDTRRTGREGLAPTRVTTATAAEVEARRQKSIADADAMWRQAEAVEPRNPEGAADLFHDLAEGHPDSPRAAEAKFREGRAAYRAHEYAQAFEALQRYMEIAAANPYLAEVEEILYRSGVEYLASIGSGFFSIFRSEDAGYRMLKYVPNTFPNGAYADDALLALGDAYRKEDDNEGWMRAALAYKLLLLSYPQSPLAARARLGLGAAYLARDQGDRWHGGFTDLDPREDLPPDLEKAAMMGEVKSGPALALEQYEGLLSAARTRPGSATADEVAQAERGVAQARERLAVKDQRIADWYAGRGGAAAAQSYRRSAAERRSGATPSVPTGPLDMAPAAAPPPVTPPPAQPPVTPPQPAAPPPAQPPYTPPPSAPTPTGPTQPAGTVDPASSSPLGAPAAPGALPPPTSQRIPRGGAR